MIIRNRHSENNIKLTGCSSNSRRIDLIFVAALQITVGLSPGLVGGCFIFQRLVVLRRTNRRGGSRKR